LRLDGRRWLELMKPKVEDVLRLCDRQTLNLVASFQRTMVNDLVAKTLAAGREYDVRTLVRERWGGRESGTAGDV
jgi:hypothetical protein